MIPTLSQVQASDWSHLRDGATYSTNLAQTYEDTWEQAKSSVAGVMWSGAARDAAVAAHVEDWTQANGHAETLRTIAAHAQNGYDSLTRMRSALLSEVDKATQAGYEVSEAFTVMPPADMSPTMVALRAPDIIQRTTDLQSRAAALAAHDAEITTQITAPQATFVSGTFTKPALPHNGTVQMVDNTTTNGPNPVAPWDVPDQHPAPSPILANYPQSVLNPPPAPPGPPMPGTTPLLPRPPIMQVAPPAPPDNMPPEQNPQPGTLIATAGTGCAGGAAGGGLLTAIFPPLELLGPLAGCVGGATLSTGGYLAGIWGNNLFNGEG